jgi:hypothetical protein
MVDDYAGRVRIARRIGILEPLPDEVGVRRPGRGVANAGRVDRLSRKRDQAGGGCLAVPRRREGGQAAIGVADQMARLACARDDFSDEIGRRVHVAGTGAADLHALPRSAIAVAAGKYPQGRGSCQHLRRQNASGVFENSGLPGMISGADANRPAFVAGFVPAASP